MVKLRSYQHYGETRWRWLKTVILNQTISIVALGFTPRLWRSSRYRTLTLRWGALLLSALVLASINVTQPLQAQRAIDPHLFLGNPSRAIASPEATTNYLIQRPQYALSYNRDRGTANWVSWQLNLNWLGSTARQDRFQADPTLPRGWYQVQPTDYQGSGFSRGHIAPSGDRKRTLADNQATFLMTNIVPQTEANNDGPWRELEEYCRELAAQGKDLYIVAGVLGNQGRIAQGRVVVPQQLWKVVLVADQMDQGIAGITPETPAIAVVIPNATTVTNRNLKTIPWRQFLTTVDQVEQLTGYDFFSQIPPDIQQAIEARQFNARLSSYGQTSSSAPAPQNRSLLDLQTIPGLLIVTVSGATLIFGSYGLVQLLRRQF